eukprot:4349480-Alexandrium_andersonii.AAC.2
MVWYSYIVDHLLKEARGHSTLAEAYDRQRQNSATDDHFVLFHALASDPSVWRKNSSSFRATPPVHYPYQGLDDERRIREAERCARRKLLLSRYF